MKIQGCFAQYECSMAEAGWTYMTVKVRKITPIAIFGWHVFNVRRVVWKSSGERPRSALGARKYLPHECRAWFEEVVAEYERHHEAWSEEIAQ